MRPKVAGGRAMRSVTWEAPSEPDLHITRKLQVHWAKRGPWGAVQAPSIQSSAPDRPERQSGFLEMRKNWKDQVICPKPRRMVVAPRDIYRSSRRPQSQSTVQCEGEPGYEILDIFLSKTGHGDQASANSSLPYFCGSPPSRSDNPLVHDVQFIRRGVPPSSVIVSQKSSCGSSFGANPSVRVEGFASSSSESHCSVVTLA